MIGSREWMYENYDVETRKASVGHNTSIRRIFCCAYRKYDRYAGGTGGPGGVLHLLEHLFGESSVAGMIPEYIYMPEERVVPENVWQQMSILNGRLKFVIAAAGYVATHKVIKESEVMGENPVLMCHDIGSAYGAVLSGRPFILIYHQQGSIIREMLSAGEPVSDIDKRIMAYIEHKVFLNAIRVYFPSNGAKDVLKESCSLSKKEWAEIRIGEFPLYNTVEDIRENISVPTLQTKAAGEVFISIGDFLYDKGLDRVPDFLDIYSKKSEQKVTWIAIGNTFDKEYVENIKEKCKKLSIIAYIVDHRVAHSELMELVAMADYYIMLHRKSIFDLASLEAMQLGKCMILSDFGSNREFNVFNNVILVNLEDMELAAEKVIKADYMNWQRLNKKAFSEYFSNQAFLDRYSKAVYDLGAELTGSQYRRSMSAINRLNFSKWKNRYDGKKCIICGSGSSLDSIKTKEENSIYIALNKALFYEPIHYDFLFMQDKPKNQVYTQEDYNRYDCIKFYGIINNSNVQVEGVGGNEVVFQNVSGEIYRYDLNHVAFDYKCDNYEYELDTYALTDAQSVLFSALQFAVFAGFKEIKLVGVEFSDINYGNAANKSLYAKNVEKNLLVFKKQLKRDRPEIEFGFVSTFNVELEQEFCLMDEARQIFVSGIYTEKYRDMVKLQEQTCKDDYVFDYRYITDEEWNKNKATAGISFYSENTIKTQLVIDKIKEYWGNVLIVTDADLIFLQKTKGDLFSRLRKSDMLFLGEAFERNTSNINIQFVAMNCNEASLKYWEAVQAKIKDNRGCDQDIVNQIIYENLTDLKYQILPETFLNGVVSRVSLYISKGFIVSV